jgi:hypothetical protein
VALTNVGTKVNVSTGKMIRKGFVTTILVAALFATVRPNTRHTIVVSVQNFEHCFQDLSGARNSINPVLRVVFSLALATAAPAAEK